MIAFLIFGAELIGAGFLAVAIVRTYYWIQFNKEQKPKRATPELKIVSRNDPLFQNSRQER